MARPVATLGVLLLAVACSSSGSTSEPSPAVQPTAPGRSAARVLILTATAAFRHDSIPTARQVMTGLAAAGAFSINATEDLSLVNPDTLRNYDVVMFALT